MRILGIDPGTGILGFGVIEANKGKLSIVIVSIALGFCFTFQNTISDSFPTRTVRPCYNSSRSCDRDALAPYERIDYLGFPFTITQYHYDEAINPYGTAGAAYSIVRSREPLNMANFAIDWGFAAICIYVLLYLVRALVHWKWRRHENIGD